MKWTYDTNYWRTKGPALCYEHKGQDVWVNITESHRGFAFGIDHERFGYSPTLEEARVNAEGLADLIDNPERYGEGEEPEETEQEYLEWLEVTQRRDDMLIRLRGRSGNW